MAKRKKSRGSSALGMAVPSSGSSEHLSTSIDGVENGYVVNVSGETGGKTPSYFSKRYIAADRPEAMRIASAGLASGRSKGSKKKPGGKKKISLKRG